MRKSKTRRFIVFIFREELLDKKKEIFLEKQLWIKENADSYIHEEEEKERQER